MGAKYIIEMEDTPFTAKQNHTGETISLWKAKNGPLVFTKEMLDVMKPLEEELDNAYLHGGLDAEGRYRELLEKAKDEAYEEGYNEGFTAGQHDSNHDGCEGCKYEDTKPSDQPCVICKQCYKDKYQKKDDEIKVGDVCMYMAVEEAQPFVITNIYYEGNKGFFHALYPDGSVLLDGTLSLIKPTGEHLIEVERFLKKMGEYS